MSMEVTTINTGQTRKAGELLAKEILKRKTRDEKSFVLALEGNLGGGKTTFLQGFAKGLGIKGKITSPTFVIMKRFGRFYHFDCYRAQRPKDILDLGWKEIVSDPKNIIVVEWADLIKKILPGNVIRLRFSFLDKNKRKIMVE